MTNLNLNELEQIWEYRRAMGEGSELHSEFDPTAAVGELNEVSYFKEGNFYYGVGEIGGGPWVIRLEKLSMSEVVKGLNLDCIPNKEALYGYYGECFLDGTDYGAEIVVYDDIDMVIEDIEYPGYYLITHRE